MTVIYQSRSETTVVGSMVVRCKVDGCNLPTITVFKDGSIGAIPRHHGEQHENTFSSAELDNLVTSLQN
jgi:hypothetical protein